MTERTRLLIFAGLVAIAVAACAPASAVRSADDGSNVPPAPAGARTGSPSSGPAPSASPQDAAPPPTFSGGQVVGPAPTGERGPAASTSPAPASGPRVCTVYRNPALGDEVAPGSLVQIVSPQNANRLSVYVVGAPDQQSERIRQLHADAGSEVMPLDFTPVGATFSESAERADQLCERWRSGAGIQ